MYALVQINFKVCRADLFSLFLCVCVYSSSVIFVVRFPFRCVPSLFIFYLHVWSQFSLLLLLLAFFRSVKMDKNKITKQNRPISVIPLGRGDTGKWHVKTKPNDVSVNERPQRCRTDIPIQLMCVMSPDLAKLPLFILSIVKTQNKSHVRAHNVLQTSYITCSGVTFFFFCLLVGFFSPSLQISLHREIRFARIWSFLRICSPPKKKIWFFMTDDGQQITLLSDLNSATWQLFSVCLPKRFVFCSQPLPNVKLKVSTSMSSECWIYTVNRARINLIQLARRLLDNDSITLVFFFIIFKALSNVNSTHQMTRFDLNKLNFFSIGLNEIRLNLSDVWYGQLRFTIWFGHNLWIKYCS